MNEPILANPVTQSDICINKNWNYINIIGQINPLYMNIYKYEANIIWS